MTPKTTSCAACLALVYLFAPAYAVRAEEKQAAPPAPEAVEAPSTLPPLTFKGTVREVEKHLLAPGIEGLDLKIDVGDRTMIAHLGPEAFVKERMQFVPGDAVEVRGAPLPGEPSVAVLTLSVTKNGKKLELRTEKGRPRYPLPGRK